VVQLRLWKGNGGALSTGMPEIQRREKETSKERRMEKDEGREAPGKYNSSQAYNRIRKKHWEVYYLSWILFLLNGVA
jgi:hypothetical protein